MGEMVYRISTLEEWEDFQNSALLHGGPLDKSTGFLHLSKASQVRGVLQQFFQGRPDLYLIAVDPAKLGVGLKYEKVEGMEIEGDDSFPHFYGPSGSFEPLSLEAVVKADKLEIIEGKHVLPF